MAKSWAVSRSIRHARSPKHYSKNGFRMDDDFRVAIIGGGIIAWPKTLAPKGRNPLKHAAIGAVRLISARPTPEGFASSRAAAGTLPAGCSRGGNSMKVSKIMSRNVTLLNPDQNICLTAEIDAGALPARDNDRLVGRIRGRDIDMRAVAQERSAYTKAAAVMSKE